MNDARSIATRVVAALAVLVMSACAGGDRDPSPPDDAVEIQPEETVEMATSPLTIASAAFDDGGAIPTQYTCDGENQSPPLRWSDPPDGVRSWALICDDPDAPGKTWVHWVIFNIPAETRALSAGIPSDEVLASGARHGRTDFGTPGYGGPCPPPGGPHRYFFKLYALDAVLELKPGATKSRLQDEMVGHVLAEGRLMGTYGR